MLLLCFVAYAGDVAPWLLALEQELDAAAPQLRSYVTYSRAV